MRETSGTEWWAAKIASPPAPFDQSVRLQGIERLADRGSAHSVLTLKLREGRQKITASEPAAFDAVPEMLCQHTGRRSFGHWDSPLRLCFTV